jgi:hypothetical protein
VSTAIDERQLLSGLRRSEAENHDLRGQIAGLREKLRVAEQRVKERLTPDQTRAVIAENAELRRMNAILLQRNEVLARKQRER